MQPLLMLRRATAKKASGQYAEVVTLAGRMRTELVQAYLLAQPSRAVEGRAYWNHTGTGAYSGDWERTAREGRSLTAWSAGPA